jgi:hypothetical protein
MNDLRVEYFEYGSFEKKSSYQVIAYKPKADGSPHNHKLTLTLFPTWQPERPMGLYIPIWFLIAAGTHFEASGSREIVIIGEVPFRVFDLAKKTKARWRVEDQYVTDFVQFFSGEFYQHGPNDSLRVDPAPQLINETNLTFRVIERTNFSGRQVPVRFEYNSYYAKTKSEHSTLLLSIEGTVERLTSDNLPRRSFTEMSGVRVNDHRLQEDGRRLPTHSYFITNGSLASLALVPSATVNNLLIEREARAGRDKGIVDKKRSWLPFLVVSAFLALLPAFWLKKRRGK